MIANEKSSFQASTSASHRYETGGSHAAVIKRSNRSSLTAPGVQVTAETKKQLSGASSA
jgi:hypothetical protein